MTKRESHGQQAVVAAMSRKVGGEKVAFKQDIAANANAGTVTTKIASPPYRCVVEGVRYINPTGLAADAANFAVLAVKQGAVVVADWSTETGQEGTLTADTYVDLTLGAAAGLIIEADEELVFEVAESGTTTVPAGQVEVYLRAVPDDIAYKVFTAKSKMRVDQVNLKALLALTTSDTDYYVFTLKQGANTVATWSTKTTGGDGTMAADTFVTMGLTATVADLILEAGETLSLDCAETGDAVLSDLDIVVHGRYL